MCYQIILPGKKKSEVYNCSQNNKVRGELIKLCKSIYKFGHDQCLEVSSFLENRIYIYRIPYFVIRDTLLFMCVSFMNIKSDMGGAATPPPPSLPIICA